MIGMCGTITFTTLVWGIGVTKTNNVQDIQIANLSEKIERNDAKSSVSFGSISSDMNEIKKTLVQILIELQNKKNR